MTITLDPALPAALCEAARKQGTAPEELALSFLRNRLLVVPIEPRDEWERKLLAAASDCGVSLSDEALSREEMY